MKALSISGFWKFVGMLTDSEAFCPIQGMSILEGFYAINRTVGGRW